MDGVSPSHALRPRAAPLGRKRRWAKIGAETGFDVATWMCSLIAAAAVTHDIASGTAILPALWHFAIIVGLLAPACGLTAGLYRGRYLRGSLEEVIGVAGAALAIACVLLVAGPGVVAGQHAPLATIMAGSAAAGAAMLSGRHVHLAFRQRSRPPAPSATKVIVFGAGEAGAQLIRRLTSTPDASYRPVAILDDDPEKRRLRIQGVPVLGDRSKIAETADATGARMLVIAIARPSGSVIVDIANAAERCGLTPKVIPSVTELLSGGARIEGVRDPRISDLLGRRPVRTDLAAIGNYFAGKRILVTGAGGSIGSEICRQLARLDPAELIMLDRDESALHGVQLALRGSALLDDDETVLGDIRDPARVREIFRRRRPDIVFHAAALKHLPLLERYPAEALKTNVWGTLAVLEAAADCGTQTFVNISTDKAADPVSVLGYSKRIAERLTAGMAQLVSGSYLSVRFGNVLGSRGSVLTTLSAQVAAGGPITVTHPEVSRYFMTADEAVQLVLQAAVIGSGGEVLVLDMGRPVRIADIARRLAAGSDRKIDIVFTGLRTGEKLTEDLLCRGEVHNQPYHPLVQHASVTPLARDQVLAIDPHAPAGEIRSALAAAAGAAGPAAGPVAGPTAGPGTDPRPVHSQDRAPAAGRCPSCQNGRPERGTGARHPTMSRPSR